MKKKILLALSLAFCFSAINLINAEDLQETRNKAEQGDAKAQYELGTHYLKGDKVEKDYKKAVKWDRKAAKQGMSKAESALGFAYMKGYGVDKDYKEAVKWLEKAAEKGNKNAQYMLGKIYLEGSKDVKKDKKKAAHWLDKVKDADAKESCKAIAKDAKELWSKHNLDEIKE